jgi:hypothetical protein
MEREPEPLVQSIAEQVRRVVDRELGVARDELQEKAAAAAGDAALILTAAVLGYGSLLALLAAAVDLARGAAGPFPRGRRPLWQGAGLVGSALGAGALALAALGTARLRQRDWVPRRTLNSLDRTADAAAQGGPGAR